MSLYDRFPIDDEIWIYSNPVIAQQTAFKKYGSNAILYRSKAKNKKYSIINPNGKIINFGQMGYEDFTKHQNSLRRFDYLQRSGKIKGRWKDDGYSPNNLSRNILW